MSEQLLFVLKLCLLALLYLFFYRVVRAVWAELKAPQTAPVDAVGAAPAKAPKKASRKDRKQAKAVAGPPARLVVAEPAARRGVSYELGAEATIGRAAGCQVPLDDSFVSQLHARVYQRDGTWFLEDLGSTNGTLMNKRKVGAPLPLRKGDRIQIGNTVLELEP